MSAMPSVISARSTPGSHWLSIASDHRYRWYYASLGSALLVLLSVAAVVDLVTLLT